MIEQKNITQEYLEGRISQLNLKVASYLDVPAMLGFNWNYGKLKEYGRFIVKETTDGRLSKTIEISNNINDLTSLDYIIAHELVHKYHFENSVLARLANLEINEVFKEKDMQRAFRKRTSYSQKIRNYIFSSITTEVLAYLAAPQITSPEVNISEKYLDKLKKNKKYSKTLQSLSGLTSCNNVGVITEPLPLTTYYEYLNLWCFAAYNIGFSLAAINYQNNKNNPEKIKKICRKLVREPPVNVFDHCQIQLN